MDPYETLRAVAKLEKKDRDKALQNLQLSPVIRFKSPRKRKKISLRRLKKLAKKTKPIGIDSFKNF